MKTITRNLNITTSYSFERLGSLSEMIYFDIETTGFSAEYCQVYLIGCVYYTDNSWQSIQWFCDTVDSESDVLNAFFDFLKPYKILIHFNGDGFDIPFIKKRCGFLGLNHDFPDRSIDIYKIIRPYRKILGMEHINQKSAESFLNISREDKYNGGQLIEIYHEYLMTHSDFLYELLMLHNADDIKGMPLITSMLSYADFFCSEFEFCGINTDESKSRVFITYKSDCNIPAEIIYSKYNIVFQAYDNMVILTIPLFRGELKFFYPDYENYYYLPAEDCAIHKSIGEYVSKSARKKASASTCYTKKEGLFLPQYSEIFKPSFKNSHRDKFSYALFVPDMFNDICKADEYLISILSYIGIS